MPQTAIKQQPAQSHGIALAYQLVGAEARAVPEPSFWSPDTLVVNPPAAEEILDEGSSSSDRTCRVH